MYEYVKIGAAFTIGLGAGILGSKRFFQTKYEKIANEEIESVKAKYSMRSGHIIERTSIEEPEEFEEKIAEEMKQPEPRIYSTIDNMYSQQEKPIPKERYSDDKEEREDRIVETLHPEENDYPEEPFEISEEEFSETELGFEKVVLHYYVADDILADADSGNTDLGQTIGDEGLNEVRIGNCIEYFFRNPNYAVDYNVIRVPGSYYIE